MSESTLVSEPIASLSDGAAVGSKACRLDSAPAGNLRMTSINELCLGQPRFSDGDGVALAAEHGALAAWQLALAQKGPAVAAAGVSGPFAIGLREPSGRA